MNTPRIVEGRLVEFPTTDGVDRRAFGEFISAHGELASYAFGWGETHGHMTVGIGRGNPGGASFNIVVFNHNGERACTLIDTPFENVPEGGPHIDADTARRRDDLPFVWWVVDHVFHNDRRAQWLNHWLLRTASIDNRIEPSREEILHIRHDRTNDLWHLTGARNSTAGGKIGRLSDAIDSDPTLTDVLDLEPGQSATRTHIGGNWLRSPSPDPR